MSDNIAIKVDHVYKDFKLPHLKKDTVKSLFTGVFDRASTKKGYELQHALHDVSFEVKKGEFFGIVGRNGSGKSTLLKMIAGIYQPSSGSISVEGKLVPFIELGVGFNAELTGRENVYLNGAMLGFSEKEISDMYDEIVTFAELEKFMDQKLKNYSSGMQVRLAFSMAIRAKAEVLLIDEVLAVGDADFQRKCFDYFQKLKKEKTTVILVTHDMNAVREYCDRAVLIEASHLVAEGTANSVSQKYTKMFIDSADKGESVESKDSRWGDEAVTYSKITCPKTIKDSDETLKFSLVATAHKDVTNVNLGFIIKSATGAHILGTNTEVEKMQKLSLKKGASAEIIWEVPNIFNDGKHYIDPAIVYKGNTQVADWWEDAATFVSLREKRTPYIVSPSLNCKINELT